MDNFLVSAQETPLGVPLAIAFAFISVFLTLFGGVMSGLTVALMSIELHSLDVLRKTGTEQERWYSRQLYPLLKRRHLALCTLLISNAAAMEALPIFLDMLIGEPVSAVVVSMTAVLLFGEIIPQAVFMRWRLPIGAWCSYLLWLLVGITFIVSYPIALLLDYLLGEGEEGAVGSKIQGRKDDGAMLALLKKKEIALLQTILDLRTLAVRNVLTPVDRVLTMEADTPLGPLRISEIKEHRSRSRFMLVYERRPLNFIGWTFTRDVLAVDPKAGRTMRQLALRAIVYLDPMVPLLDVLQLFGPNQKCLAIVRVGGQAPTSAEEAQDGKTLGIITTEDLLDMLLREEQRESAHQTYRPIGITAVGPGIPNVPLSQLAVPGSEAEMALSPRHEPERAASSKLPAMEGIDRTPLLAAERPP